MDERGAPTSQMPTPEPGSGDVVTTSRKPSWAVVLGVVAVIALVVAWLIFFSSLFGAGDADPTATPTPSASASAPATDKPSEEPSATPEPSDAPTPTPEPSAEAGPIDVAWTAATGINTLSQLNDIAYLDGQWVAAGGTFTDNLEAAIWTSDDGATWTQAEIDSTRGPDEYTSVEAVAEIDGTLVAVGSWGAVPSDQRAWISWRSTDGGATWTESREGANPYAANTVINTGSRLIAAGWTYAGTTPFDSYFVTSTDGITWEQTDAVLPQAEVDALSVIGDRIVAAGHLFTQSGPYDAAAWYSDDGGDTWTAADVPDDGNELSMHDLVPFGDGLAAIGDGGDANVAAFITTSWTTTDGTTWELARVADGAFARAMGAVDGGLVAVGNFGAHDIGPGVAWTSTDAATWLEGGGPLGTGAVRLTAVAGNGDVAVAGGGCEGGCETVIWVGEVSR